MCKENEKECQKAETKSKKLRKKKTGKPKKKM